MSKPLASNGNGPCVHLIHLIEDKNVCVDGFKLGSFAVWQDLGSSEIPKAVPESLEGNLIGASKTTGGRTVDHDLRKVLACLNCRSKSSSGKVGDVFSGWENI